VLSPNSIRVTWNSPSSLSLLIGYIISYNGVENFANDSSVAVSRSSSATTLNGLEEFVRYDITVQVIYNDRLGPISDEVRVATLSSGK